MNIAIFFILQYLVVCSIFENINKYKKLIYKFVYNNYIRK